MLKNGVSHPISFDPDTNNPGHNERSWRLSLFFSGLLRDYKPGFCILRVLCVLPFSDSGSWGALI
jgi:hypothetical protein